MGLTVSATASAPTESGTSMGQGQFEDERNPAESSPLEAEAPKGPEIGSAELLPGDLESLERALGQLMRRFGGMGEDLRGWFAESSRLELLVATGVLVVVGEVYRRWRCGQQGPMVRARVGSSGRPGPLYRLGAHPSRRPGVGRMEDRPALS
jgi:hypothetical protein